MHNSSCTVFMPISLSHCIPYITVQICTQSMPIMTVVVVQGSAPGRMKGLLVSYANDLYLYGGMPHTAFTSTRAVSATSFAYPEGETIFMKLSHSAGSKWQSVSCEGAVPESRTRIHSGHAGKRSSHAAIVALVRL